MKAKSYTILEKRRDVASIAVVSIDDFRLEEDGETAVSMLTYGDCCPADLTAVYATLDKDSQAGTVLAQDAEERTETGAETEDLAELQTHLQNHPFIRTADYEVPNTLHLK